MLTHLDRAGAAGAGSGARSVHGDRPDLADVEARHQAVRNRWG